MSGFVIQGLPPAPFRPLFGMPDATLAERGAIRMTCDAAPGFPCRVTLADAEPGETLLLLNYEHLPVASPYRSTHAIFVREAAQEAARYENRVPEMLTRRLLSVRAFDANGMMIDADVVDGVELEPTIERMFDDPRTAYLHAHNAKPGCFAARIDRR